MGWATIRPTAATRSGRGGGGGGGGGGAQAKSGGDPTDHYFEEAFSGVAEEKGGF